MLLRKCIVLFLMWIMDCAIGWIQQEALKNKEIKPTASCKENPKGCGGMGGG